MYAVTQTHNSDGTPKQGIYQNENGYSIVWQEWSLGCENGTFGGCDFCCIQNIYYWTQVNGVWQWKFYIGIPCTNFREVPCPGGMLVDINMFAIDVTATNTPPAGTSMMYEVDIDLNQCGHGQVPVGIGRFVYTQPAK
jgi:hypothetical protein